MVLILKKGASVKEIQEMDKILYKKEPHTGFNADKYNGKLKLKDALAIQKKLRDEWERNIS